MYLPADRDLVTPFLRRSVAAGAFGLLLTIDGPAAGYGFGFRAPLPPTAGPTANFQDVPDRARLAAAADISTDDITRLRDLSGLPVLTKGILRADDARAAVAAGAAGIVVSNHGGRQPGGSMATAHVLAEVVDAVGGSVPVLVDGGIRRPEDVVRALALGARAVLIVRPVARASAAGSQAVEGLVTDLVEGTRTAATMCGARNLRELGRDLLEGHQLVRARV